MFYRFQKKDLEVFLVHPGGPFWQKKDKGAWTIPKGEVHEHEEPIYTALREVGEETGIIAEGYFTQLTPVKQKSGKIVYAWATELDFDPALLTSNTFDMEWPPRSGKKRSFPEVDKGAWFTVDQAETYLLEGQRPLLHELKQLLSA